MRLEAYAATLVLSYSGLLCATASLSAHDIAQFTGYGTAAVDFTMRGHAIFGTDCNPM